MEKGFFQFPNELFDWFLLQASKLTKRELIILLAVIRNTLGYHRDQTYISCRYISQATGIRFNHISTAVHTLEQKGYLIVDRSQRTNRVKPVLPDSQQFPIQEQLDSSDSSQFRNSTVPNSGTKQFPIQELNSSRFRNKERKNKESINTTNKEGSNVVGIADWLLPEQMRG